MAIPGVPKPRNIAEWEVDQTRKIRLAGFEPQLVDMVVTPQSTGVPITVKIMRLYLRELDGVAGEWEMNLASKQGMVAMNEILARPDWRELLLEVTRQGAPPKTKWVIRIVR